MELKGCNLTKGCAPPEVIEQTYVNFLLMDSFTDLKSKKVEEITTLANDIRNYYVLDTNYRQISNLLYLESTIVVTNPWDILYFFPWVSKNFEFHSKDNLRQKFTPNIE